MPPRKKLDPEAQREAFEKWKVSDEYMQMELIITEKSKLSPIGLDTRDLFEHWEVFLEQLFKLVCMLKVPHKSKSYE